MEKRYKWTDLVKMYPDKWLVLKDCTYAGADVDECTLIEVLSDDEITAYEDEHVGFGYEYERTTEGHFGGVINLENAEIRVE